MDFGKNRIQYQDFNWTYLDYNKFRVYSYAGGGDIAKYVAVSVKNQMPILEKRLEFQLEDKLNVIVYNNQKDFNQSNLGLNSDESSNIGGTTKMIGDKIFVFFNGSHADLDKQIRYALAELMIKQMLYGGNAREMVRNSTLLNLPYWYTQGLAQYLAEGWDSKYDNMLYDALKTNSIDKFNKLSGQKAADAGHAIWHYVVDMHGESYLPNLLYMTKMNRSPDYSFLFVLGISLDNLLYDFIETQNRRLYMSKDSARTSPINNNSVLKKYKANVHYYCLKISPDAKTVAYATSQLNQLKVFVKDIDAKKPKRVLKFGPKIERLADYSYPLMDWHPDKTHLAIVYEKKNQLRLLIYNKETGEKRERNFPGFEIVNSISYDYTGKKLLVSGVKKGKAQSDIFVFTVNNSGLEQITDDIWDDKNPVFVKNSTQIVFESNRTNDTLGLKDEQPYLNKFNRNMDLFMASYPLSNPVLVRVTNTRDIDEKLPQVYSNDYISYVSDKNGIYNRYIAKFDSALAFVDTTEHYRYYFNSRLVGNLDRNILEQDFNQTSTHVAEVFYYKGKDYLAVSPLSKLNEVPTPSIKETWFKMTFKPILIDPYFYGAKTYVNEFITPTVSTPVKKDGIDFENYQLTGDKNKVANNEKEVVKLDTGAVKKPTNEDKTFKFPIQQNYFTSFYTDYVVTQFDNSFMGTNYQRFSGGGSPVYLNPGLNFLTKIGVSDLFEDHRIVGAYRFAGISDLFTIGGVDNEFLISYEYRKKLIDHQFVAHRQSFVKIDNFYGFPARAHTHDIRYTAKYPFNEVMSLRGSALLRNDKFAYFSLGDVSLPKKPDYDFYSGLRMEFVYDNTRPVMLNILNGIRGKVWVEYWRRITSDRHDLITSGFDFRHYQKIHRQLTWCNRIAGGNSLGTDRLLFYLGGVDNWFNAS
ncbi:MAG: TolB family protein, partial [Bacteroidia bacterium]